MAEYQVIARKYRPKTFKEVVGQDPIVKTLKNALKFNRLAHAYLFSGSRGTGKTTLARIFAKSLNCSHLSEDFEPCSKCPSCLEIASGCSIDVLEIDGASHRGIDDIRIISESVGYAPSKGRFKIYIIDEVHMLTKEAFNALLKTLEEPPATVKFFFATTEPHKVPETILSRCQRFNLKRFPLSLIMKKLEYIAKDLNVEVENGALHRIAEFAEGGLRDAESLFDQIIAFSDGKISLDLVHEILGVLPRNWFLELDRAFSENDYAACFRIAEEVFLQGKDLTHFLEDLTTHYRSLLLLKLSPNHPLPELDAAYKEALFASQIAYTEDQCLHILDKIMEARSNMKGAVSEKIALEALLLNICREKNRLSIAALTKRLFELEQAVGKADAQPINKVTIPDAQPILQAKMETKAKPEVKQEIKTEVKEKPVAPVIEPVDARLEILPALAKKPEPIAQQAQPAAMPAQALPEQKTEVDDMQKKSRYDTLVQFAAVELGGTVQKKK